MFHRCVFNYELTNSVSISSLYDQNNKNIENMRVGCLSIKSNLIRDGTSVLVKFISCNNEIIIL